MEDKNLAVINQRRSEQQKFEERAANQGPSDKSPFEPGEKPDTKPKRRVKWSDKVRARLEDDEGFQGFLTERGKAREAEGQRAEAATRKDMTEGTATLRQSLSAINRMSREMAKLRERGQLNAETVRALFQKNGKAFAAYDQLHRVAIETFGGQSYATGAATVAKTLADAAKLSEKEYNRTIARFVEPIVTSENGAGPYRAAPEFWGDRGNRALKELVKSVRVAAEERGYEKALRESKDTAAERTKAEAREGQGPSKAGGTAVTEAPLSKDLTPEQVAEMLGTEEGKRRLQKTFGRKR